MQSYVYALIELVTFWTQISQKLPFLSEISILIVWYENRIFDIVWINFRHASLFQTGPSPQIDNNRDNFIKLVPNLRKMYGTRCENYEFRKPSPTDFLHQVPYPRDWV